MDSEAPAGSVTIHDNMIFPTTRTSIAPIPLASPTPKTAPTSVCVVETGRLAPDATTTVVAAARFAANPRLGVNSVILRPTVSMTR